MLPALNISQDCCTEVTGRLAHARTRPVVYTGLNIDRNERSVIATLVNTKMTFIYVNYIGGGQLWDQWMGMFSPQLIRRQYILG